MPQDVEIKTHDGTILRGWFYPAGTKAPVVIMSAGLSGIKEHHLPAYAEQFQRAGYAVILYDHRNWGESDGTQDTHDVVHYTSTQLDVDPARIAIWGSSFSGGIALIVGATDPRVKVVLSQVPFMSGTSTRSRLPAVILDKLFADRGETTSSDPTYIRTYPETLEEAQNPVNGTMVGTEETFRHYQHTQSFEPRRENKITLQSLFHAIRSEPKNYVVKLRPSPLFMAVSLKDSLIDPQIQLDAFHTAGEPKELLKLDCGHFEVYHGCPFKKNIAAQLAFLDKYL
ncbi:Alpha/Beta hydrolase protein [Aspergillus cavernicola]|uniref:Alpha/Beta hydrolase protein n=1 Tax=Aspergillus cavernicola TaxID=176166 RepID=A0ABR4HH91_9EURO